MSIGDGVGKRIKSARMTRGISKTALAKAVGCTPTAVWNWEENEIAPRHETLIQVAEALGVSAIGLKTGGEKELSGPASEQKTLSVSEVVEQARVQIAHLTGFDPAHVKLHLELIAK